MQWMDDVRSVTRLLMKNIKYSAKQNILAHITERHSQQEETNQRTIKDGAKCNWTHIERL